MTRLLAWLGFRPSIPGIEPLPRDLRMVARQLLNGEPPSGWHALSSSAQARVARGHWRGEDVVLKVFLPRDPLELLKSLFRGSRGVRAVRRGHELEADGFHAPVVLAHGWDGTREILLMRAVAGDSLSRLISSRLGPPLLPVTDRQAVQREFAAEVARLHHLRWLHGDLRLGNVLLSPPRPGGNFVFLDNESSRKVDNDARLRKNLVQLNMMRPRFLSRSSRLRFLLKYAQTSEMSRSEVSELAKYLMQATEVRRAERNQRGGPKARFTAGAS
ncbi:hypothetical protein M0534_11805 [Methylonatrum kenyense]|uniref:lipopolysaccharide kinase InaA family protein n=1 Tax=Methylonatrum kenyense TaxID=455253 RepID=UPI0020C1887C|nr:lipopolysaccharide kinase InaA family protein [Methylonatrum kenyense]MCK8517003.1 hypothetical protein [Methylonatrum kenyense]